MTHPTPHNRQLPLASKFEDEIRKEEIRAVEEILARQCLDRVARKANATARTRRRTGPQPVSADIIVHITTCMKDNPGPGAWAASIATEEGSTSESDYYSSMPKPLLELEALIAVLTVIKHQRGTVAVHTTARWIADCLNNGLAESWEPNGWQKSSGGSVAHVESWKELFRLCRERSVQVCWVGTGTTPEMKQCGALAKQTFNTKRSLD